MASSKMTEVDLKKGSYNRLWIVLACLAFKYGKATLKELADLSGMPRSSTEYVLTKVVKDQVPELVLIREKAHLLSVNGGCFYQKITYLNTIISIALTVKPLYNYLKLSN